jgi:YggT family protein
MAKILAINFLYIFSNVYFVLIFTRIILSFFPIRLHKLRLFVFNSTEPVLAPIRKVIPPLGGVMDLSPIIFYLLLEIIIELVSRYFR